MWPHLQFSPQRDLLPAPVHLPPSRKACLPLGSLNHTSLSSSASQALPPSALLCSFKAEVLQGSVLGPLSSCSVLCADDFLQGHHVPWMHLYPPMCAVFTLSSSPRLKTQPNLMVNAQHYLLPRSPQESSPGTWKPFSVLTVRKHPVPLPSWPPEGHPHGPCHQGRHPTYFQTCYHYSLLKFSTAIVFFS